MERSTITSRSSSQLDNIPPVVHASGAVLQLERLIRTAPRQYTGKVRRSIRMLRSMIASGELERLA
jgi:hypothetical protein